MGTWPTCPCGKATIFSQFYKYFPGLNKRASNVCCGRLIQYPRQLSWKAIILIYFSCGIFDSSFFPLRKISGKIFALARTVIIVYIKAEYFLMTISKELANTGKHSSISSANQICSQFNKKDQKGLDSTNRKIRDNWQKISLK